MSKFLYNNNFEDVILYYTLLCDVFALRKGKKIFLGRFSSDLMTFDQFGLIRQILRINQWQHRPHLQVLLGNCMPISLLPNYYFSGIFFNQDFFLLLKLYLSYLNGQVSDKKFFRPPTSQEFQTIWTVDHRQKYHGHWQHWHKKLTLKHIFFFYSIRQVSDKKLFRPSTSQEVHTIWTALLGAEPILHKTTTTTTTSLATSTTTMTAIETPIFRYLDHLWQQQQTMLTQIKTTIFGR